MFAPGNSAGSDGVLLAVSDQVGLSNLFKNRRVILSGIVFRVEGKSRGAILKCRA